MDSSRPKPERMEETLEGGRGPPRAVAPLEEERSWIIKIVTQMKSATSEKHISDF